MPSLDEFPVSLPFAPISPNVDAEAISLSFLPYLTTLAPSSFSNSAVWRDIYALTGTIRTFYGSSSILEAWNSTSKVLQSTNFALQPKSAQVFHAGPANWIQAIYTFETEKTKCQAIVALVQDEDGEWRIWLLRTILEGLKGREVGSVDFLEPKEANSGGNEKEENHLDCVVVGAGQAGLCVAGRLEALGLRYVVLEKHPEVGDTWKRRYDSVKLHLPRETAHLPFERTFGPEYPDYVAKDQLGDGYKKWAEKYGINVWTNTEFKKGEWNETENTWTLKVQQGKTERSITSSHVVVAVGSHHIPNIPELPDQKTFQGTVLHSVQYKNASAWKWKRGIIIGAGTTAHDIAEDMVEADLASVTMVQRSPTFVVPAEYLRELFSHSYNDQIPTHLSDLFTWSMPFAALNHLFNGGIRHHASLEPERFDALEKVGFKLERDGSVAEHVFGRFGGHYVDVGASKKISDGLINIKSDSLPTKFTPDGLAFSDNSILPADVVIFATGFRTNFRPLVSELFSPSIADAMGDFWGFSSEGEVRGAFRPGGQKGMFYAGGDQSQCRYFSRFLALSIKADIMGAPLRVYDGET